MKSSRTKALIGAVLIFIQTILSFYVLVKAKRYNFMPNNYLIGFVIILIILLALAIVAQFFGMWQYAGYAVSVYSIIAFIFIGTMIGKDVKEQADAVETTAIMDVIVLKDSKVVALEEISDDYFGVVKGDVFAEKTIETVNSALSSKVKTMEFENNTLAAEALLNGSIKAMVIDTTLIETMGADFDTKVKAIKKYSVSQK